MCPGGRERQGWIAPHFPESKARKRACGAKSCLNHDPENHAPHLMRGGCGFSEKHASGSIRGTAQTSRWIGKTRCPYLSVHSFAPALRWPRLPRKFHAVTACRNADFEVCTVRMNDRPTNGPGHPEPVYADIDAATRRLMTAL